MKRLLACWLVLAVAPLAQAGPNLLVNGNFDSGTGFVYYDGFDPSIADDEPGWLISLGAADGSYVQIAPEVNPLAGVRDVDMGIGPAGGGLQTAVGSRPLVTPLVPYHATVTYDNYFGPGDAAYFIDWFDIGGSLISSDGGPLGDPNGPLGYAPYTQLFEVTASAPAAAASAGVRFTSGNSGYNGLAADNFHFGIVPEPSSLALLALGSVTALVVRRRVKR